MDTELAPAAYPSPVIILTIGCAIMNSISAIIAAISMPIAHPCIPDLTLPVAGRKWPTA